MNVNIDLIGILGMETVISACDYNWEEMKIYKAGTAEYNLWMHRWYMLCTELKKAGYEWETPESREIERVRDDKYNCLKPNSSEARQGEDK